MASAAGSGNFISLILSLQGKCPKPHVMSPQGNPCLLLSHPQTGESPSSCVTLSELTSLGVLLGEMGMVRIPAS